MRGNILRSRLRFPQIDLADRMAKAVGNVWPRSEDSDPLRCITILSSYEHCIEAGGNS